MPQKKPLEELSKEEKSSVLHLKEIFPAIYREYLKLIRENSSKTYFDYGEKDLKILREGEMFERILQTSHKMGSSFVNVYRIMVENDCSIQKALSIAEPEDQVDKRTLQRYIDEAYIAFNKRNAVAEPQIKFAVKNKIEVSIESVDYQSADGERIIKCFLKQVVDKRTGIYEEWRRYACYNGKTGEELPIFRELFWLWPSISNKAQHGGVLHCKNDVLPAVLLEIGEYWKKMEKEAEQIVSFVPELARLNDDCYYDPYYILSNGNYLIMKDGALYFSDLFYESVRGGREGFLKRYPLGSEDGKYLDLNFYKAELLDAEDAFILQRHHDYICTLNKSELDSEKEKYEMNKLGMAFGSSVKKYMLSDKEIERMLFKTHNDVFLDSEDYVDGRHVDREPGFEIKKAFNMFCSFSSSLMIPAETLFYLFVKRLGANASKENAWEYYTIIEEYLLAVEKSSKQNFED